MSTQTAIVEYLKQKYNKMVLTTKEFADETGISVKQQEALRAKNKMFVNFVNMGQRNIRYSIFDVALFMENGEPQNMQKEKAKAKDDAMNTIVNNKIKKQVGRPRGNYVDISRQIMLKSFSANIKKEVEKQASILEKLENAQATISNEYLNSITADNVKDKPVARKRAIKI